MSSKKSGRSNEKWVHDKFQETLASPVNDRPGSGHKADDRSDFGSHWQKIRSERSKERERAGRSRSRSKNRSRRNNRSSSFSSDSSYDVKSRKRRRRRKQSRYDIHYIILGNIHTMLKAVKRLVNPKVMYLLGLVPEGLHIQVVEVSQLLAHHQQDLFTGKII